MSSRLLPWTDGVTALCQDEEKLQLRAVVCLWRAAHWLPPPGNLSPIELQTILWRCACSLPVGPTASICRAGIQTPISRIGSAGGLLPSPVEAERSSLSAISLEIPRRTPFLIASNRCVWHVHAVLAKSLTALHVRLALIITFVAERAQYEQSLATDREGFWNSANRMR